MDTEEIEMALIRFLLDDQPEALMRLSARRCSCGRKALTPASKGRSRMREGWVYRKGHDECVQCWKSYCDSFRARIKRASPRDFSFQEEGKRSCR